MLDSLGLEPLETPRKLSGQCMMYKTIHGLVGLNIHNYLQFSEETRTRDSDQGNPTTFFGKISVRKTI